jgi:hypothetical protein
MQTILVFYFDFLVIISPKFLVKINLNFHTGENTILLKYASLLKQEKPNSQFFFFKYHSLRLVMNN